MKSSYFEYNILEENLIQLENFRKNDINKFLTLYSKTEFLSNSYNEANEASSFVEEFKYKKKHSKTMSDYPKIKDFKQSIYYSNYKENWSQNSNKTTQNTDRTDIITD